MDKKTTTTKNKHRFTRDNSNNLKKNICDPLCENPTKVIFLLLLFSA